MVVAEFRILLYLAAGQLKAACVSLLCDPCGVRPAVLKAQASPVNKTKALVRTHLAAHCGIPSQQGTSVTE